MRTVLNQLLYSQPAPARPRDVAHVFCAAYWSSARGGAGGLAARALGSAILNYHSGEAPDHLARWGGLVHPWLRRADAIAVPSEFLGETVARHGYRAHVIPNVVELARFRFRDRDPRRLRLLSVRNLEPHYRVGNTIEALARLRRRHPAAGLTIAGYGAEEGHLRRMAAPLGDGVRFVGRVEPADIPDLYDAHDVFLNSSVIDNQPLSILEAFASGPLRHHLAGASPAWCATARPASVPPTILRRWPCTSGSLMVRESRAIRGRGRPSAAGPRSATMAASPRGEVAGSPA
jgi:glycosyltransferase involved in cell wall biosynthesis